MVFGFVVLGAADFRLFVVGGSAREGFDEGFCLCPFAGLSGRNSGAGVVGRWRKTGRAGGANGGGRGRA